MVTNRFWAMKREPVMRRRISDLLRKEGSLTIPEIAEKLDASPEEVTLWVLGMWRYGLIEEEGRKTPEGYSRFAVKEAS